jgi:hypothetical protein
MSLESTRTCFSMLALAAATGLAACGGGGDDGGGGAAGGTLTLSASTPATHNTSADPSKAATRGNDARAADGFSSVAYCDVYFEDFAADNGKRYALQVYFRQTDGGVINVSLIDATAGAPSWVVFHNNAGAVLAGVAVDRTARTITFTAKVVNGSAGETTTIGGTIGFVANATGTTGCGV